MLFSEAWLREFTDPSCDTEQLVARLTMAGLEVDRVVPVAGAFSSVVVGEVLGFEPHPQADRLRVCRVAAGFPEPLIIVCGAPNVVAGMKVPLATVGATLPGGVVIKAAPLRGVMSSGMLCSARELGIEEQNDGLWVLPADARPGTDVRTLLNLDDVSIEVDLTPNRADCLGVLGIAREVATLTGSELHFPQPPAHASMHDRVMDVTISETAACPRYLGRLIKGIGGEAVTPFWMLERLRRCGIRAISPVVDITNYVLQELGQPLHAFDAGKIQGGVRVRFAHDGESIQLLNGQIVELCSDVLVIADAERALAFAGVMGGSESAVNAGTVDIFLESAFFAPGAIMGKARRYGLNTDASHRYERGVDPDLQRIAMERATQLLLDIVGGSAGPIIERVSANALPQRASIVLREARIAALLGVALERQQIESILLALGMDVRVQDHGWSVTPPGFRFDIAIEADLIEEIGRVYGYDNIPKREANGRVSLQPEPESQADIERIKDVLAARGYHEAITYSFVDMQRQTLLDPATESYVILQNPISSDMSVMRTGLWAGLIDAALKNLNRQQARVRLFESGLRFSRMHGEISQTPGLAGLVVGSVYPEQWGEKSRGVDFFDIKSHVEAILRLAGHENEISFVPGKHHALHPGQCAEIVLRQLRLGWIGMLHPELEKTFGFEQPVFLFELDQTPLLRRGVVSFDTLSRFPQVRRDIALIVNESVQSASLVNSVKQQDALIREVVVFDVYQGPGIADAMKSVALGLVLQDDNETLTDNRVDAVIADVLVHLKNQFDAQLRE
ncbi:phenylalanine--tRNA ligase subunit beta [Candidatus Methylospira mobilis]|uniref:Phenylalanine--tRNA ligase beta subunit n=1 Tax=Candidatus Methylospira mobilis TaxID=1808979 RepID=A0A5Q0BK04_9GAMM|nr:phenylalanine--tRNA ligase subunit beta [Candidatus Methylospira mobilis]QFY42514.1 phenylalanine--tRNA ligase subunit beta [Candidatus Methylospira mobilis]WNV04379.1 phenylalanine--tRNA ligase subunit beta [Candidatus Methylospira mobilis]